MKHHSLPLILFVVVTLVASAAAACVPAAPAAPAVKETVVVTATPEPVKLVVLTHWGEESLLKPMQAKIEEYQKLNPHVTIEYQTVPFDQLLTKIVSGRAAGISPDVYHFYNLWMPEFVRDGMLAVPPDEIIADIKANYSLGSIEAVTSAGQIWGHPTEINTDRLLYNKKLLAEAGYQKPPETWDELKEMAAAITKKDAEGKITQSGFGIITGWDSGVVHPFLSLLWSNGGQYIDAENAKAYFNDQKGAETLQLYMDMIGSGGIDLGSSAWDFPSGKVAMTIMANWWRASLKQSFVDGYENVGVAPVPHTPGNQSATLQYNWLFAVDNGSKHRDEAWKFVQWMNTPASAGQPSPIGDFLVNALGAIPSRISDQEALADQLSDHFLKPFVESTAYAQPEPVVAGGQEVKTRLQTEIEAAWFGKKAPQEALDAAAAEAEQILLEKK
jgi:multiple sugar transport system substrate-binding protein